MSDYLKSYLPVACLIINAAIANPALGQNWFPTSAPQQTWTAVALSSGGSKLVAVSSEVPGNNYGYVFTSTNGGANWTQSGEPSQHWVCAASSADGTALVAATGYLNGQIYRSTDSGVSWTPTGAPGNEWRCIASSADGSILVAAAYGSYLYVSTDSGADWTNCILGQYWTSLFCSADGSIMAAAGGGGQSVFISTNSGEIWSEVTNLPTLTWSSLAGSTNGNDLVIVANSGQIFTSTNIGATWTSNSLPNGSSASIAVSGDAQLLVAGTTGAIYTSTNLGLTWNTNSAPNNVSFGPVACSADGSKMAAVGNNLIYVSPPALQSKGSVVAWDINNYGQAAVPFNLGAATAIAGSQYDSLAVKTDGTVAAWGLNDLGETNVPPGLVNVEAVAASQQLSLAIKEDGTLGWWGSSTYTNIIPSLSNITAVAASQGNFYMALQSNGIATAWGVNGYGQTNVPIGLSNVVAIAVGDYHSMALKSDGTVSVWGGNVKGTYGPTNIPGGLSNVVAIAAGNICSLALKNDGTIIGWPTNDANVVQRIPTGLSNIVSIAADHQHALALTKDGMVWEWGTVGTGFLNYQVGLSNIVDIACGYYHSLAIVGDGSPSIIQQPWSQTSYGGYSTFMYAGVVGAPPTAYQWQLNGTNVDGATNLLLNLNAVTPSDAGIYTLIASNSLGTAVSSNASLTVVTYPPVLTLQPTNQTVVLGSNVTLTVALGAGPIPNIFQWQINGTNIIGATNVSLTLTNIQTTNQGNYSVVVNNGFGTTTSSNAYLFVIELDLPTALNTPGWTWTTSGNVPWFPQTSASHDGFEAAQSGLVANGQSSALQTILTGPGTLTFWWMFSPLASPFPNTLAFSSSQANASVSVNATTGWQQQTIYLGAGQQTLTWNYSRSPIASTQSTGWVDQVSFTPGGTPPTLTSMSPNAFVRANSSVVFVAGAYGTPPLSYQWQLNGTNLFNKTNAFLNLSGVQPTNSGTYSVIITNSFGTVTTNATLWVGQFAVNTIPTNLFMSSNGFQLQLDGILTTNPVVILGSTDLINWLPLFTNSATTGSVQYLDVSATNTPTRFYRAQE